MSRSSTAAENDILQIYRQYVLEKGEPPASVFALCQTVGMSEADFYRQYASLKSLDAAVFADWAKRAWDKQCASPEHENYNARQRLLGFYYNLLDLALEQRSFLLMQFPKRATGLLDSRMQRLETVIAAIGDSIVTRALETGEFSKRAKLSDYYSKAFFPHFGLVVRYYLRDESHGFEDTDAFVDKTVDLLFQTLGEQIIDSAIDLARFVVGRRA